MASGAGATGATAPASDVLDASPEGPTDPLRVLVVDDHRSYAEAVATAVALRLPGAVVDHVHTIPAARDFIAARAVDVLVLDWQLGDDDGIEFAREVARQSARPRIVMLTAHHSPALVRLALHVGAHAALPKHATIASIVDAITAASADTAIDPAPVSTSATDRVLTGRQLEVLWLLSTGADIRSIAGRLFLSVETVRSYVKDALRRLGAHNQLEAVAIARRNGLIPADPVPLPQPPGP